MVVGQRENWGNRASSLQFDLTCLEIFESRTHIIVQFRWGASGTRYRIRGLRRNQDPSDLSQCLVESCSDVSPVESWGKGLDLGMIELRNDRIGE